jgi:hypothetical protein
LNQMTTPPDYRLPDHRLHFVKKCSPVHPATAYLAIKR